MANSSLYEKIVSKSPHVEMLARRTYRILEPAFRGKLKPKKKKNNNTSQTADFDKVLDYLKEQEVRQGDILVVHSSFSALKKFGLSPAEIIDKLLKFVGQEGTLAMPGIPIFPDQLIEGGLPEAELIQQKYIYDVNSTKIWTGALPKEMIKRDDSERSHHPLNSMVAIGAKAKEMMKDNDKELYANGKKSSWNYCAVNKAFVLGLGTDLTHSLTMIHVAEDTKGENWYIKNWYQDRVFIVKDENKEKEIKVKERRYNWGKLHFGERNLAEDLIKDKIMDSHIVENTLLESMRADELIQYLNSRNKAGYPYFWVSKHLKKKNEI